MFDDFTVLAVAGTFLVAGIIKGVIGLGLPTVSLALMTVAIDLPNAMALLLVPSLVTNLWQALVGGNGRAIMFRLWPFLLMATVTVWLGASALTRVDISLLSALLGAVLIVYSASSLTSVHFTLSPRQEMWVGPLMGSVNGILTGMTGSFVVPGVIYLQAIGLSRDALIQAMGMLFTASTLSLAVALHGRQLLKIEHATLSAAGVLPAVIGMMLGQQIRNKLSEQLFQRVFFFSLLTLGLYIIIGEVGRFN